MVKSYSDENKQSMSRRYFSAMTETIQNLPAQILPIVLHASVPASSAAPPSPAVNLPSFETLDRVGRSMIGRRRLLPTVAETIGIAAAAAFAGLAIGKLIS